MVKRGVIRLSKTLNGLDKIEQAIRQDDGDYLIDIFGRAKRARDTRFADPDLKDNSEV